MRARLSSSSRSLSSSKPNSSISRSLTSLSSINRKEHFPLWSELEALVSCLTSLLQCSSNSSSQPRGNIPQIVTPQIVSSFLCGSSPRCRYSGEC